MADSNTEYHDEDSERRFRALLEQSSDATAIFSASGSTLYISPSVKNVLGYTEQEAMQLNIFDVCHDDDKEAVAAIMKKTLDSPGIPIRGHIGRMMHKDGKWRWLDAMVTNLLHDPAINGIVNNFRDITERIETEKKLLHANRLYAFISQVNQAIVHTTTEKDLFDQVCRIATETGEFKTVWIGLFDKNYTTINLQSQSNILPEDIPGFTNIPFADNGPHGTILSTKAPYICNNIQKELPLNDWKAYAKKRGYESCMVIPLKQFDTIVGSFSIYSSEYDFFNDKEVDLLVAAANDISFALEIIEKTRQKQIADEKLAHSERKLKEAQAIAHFGSWEIDLEKNVTVWSEEALRIYGLPETDTLQQGDVWLQHVHPDDLEMVKKISEETWKYYQNSAYFHRIIRKDGDVRSVYVVSKFEFDKEGKPYGIYGVIHDVTDLKLADEKMKQSEANLNMIMDLIPQYIFAKDYHGRFVFANKSFAELCGLRPEDMVTRTMIETIPADNNVNKYLEQDRRIIDTGIQHIEPVVLFKDLNGNERVFHTTKVPYVLPGTNEKVVLGVAQDITEQRRTEKERANLLADMMQRNKDLEQFSYITSHNLRSPVANIKGLTDLLNTEGNTAEEVAVFVQELHVAAGKLDDVIKDLNQILQIKNNAAEHTELLRFDSVVSDVCLSISDQIKNEGVEIIVNFGKAPEINTIKSYLHSIFFNLISNSIRYRLPDRAAVIHIETYKTDDLLTVVYKDNGQGIDLEKWGNHVFGMYRKFHNNTEGKGMGLYMTKTHVETMGGRIYLESEVNKGVTFTIEYPTTL